MATSRTATPAPGPCPAGARLGHMNWPTKRCGTSILSPGPSSHWRRATARPCLPVRNMTTPGRQHAASPRRAIDACGE
eukprot:4005258-Lingulodinium_polyedra.AAC.1